MYKVLPKSRELNIDFYTSIHTEFPMIAPFTCVCSPDFGCGFQISTDCFARAKEEDLPKLEEIAAKSKDGVKIPCIMYVSSKALASDIDLQLKKNLGSQSNLVQNLKDMGYFT